MKVWKFCEAGSGSLLHRERIDLGDTGAVEPDDIESEIRRHECCVSGGRTARRWQVVGGVTSLVSLVQNEP